ncbi:redoxin domain-containing protein [Rubritalea tangerina]|uniref:redoxin domain-containing protein n=1 Tax=Rubritalea tangerina TaxID=430798 RepID=UPI0036100511
MREAGAELITISPQSDSHNRKMEREHKLKFHLLHDPNLAVADTIGIGHTLPPELQEVYSQFGVNLPEINAMDTWRLPMPARYVIDETGVVRDRQVHADYTVRPEPSEILEVLQKLKERAA